MKLKTYNEIAAQHLENIKGGASMTTSVYMIYQQGRLEGMVSPAPVRQFDCKHLHEMFQDKDDLCPYCR